MQNPQESPECTLIVNHAPKQKEERNQQSLRETPYPLQSAGQAMAQYHKGIMFFVTFEGGQPQPQWQANLTLDLGPLHCSAFKILIGEGCFHAVGG